MRYRHMVWRTLLACAPALINSLPAVELAIWIGSVDHIDSESSHWRGSVVVHYSYLRGDFGTPPQPRIANGEVTAQTHISEKTDGDRVTVATRYFASFHFNGDYSLFPFDEQCLTVEVELELHTSADVQLAELPGHSGVTAEDSLTGRRFSIPHFRFDRFDLQLHSEAQEECGLPFAKQRLRLRVFVQRVTPFYGMTCIMFPLVSIVVAITGTFLPHSPIHGRLLSSVAATIVMVGALLQMIFLAPPGFWCWLYSAIVFFLVLLAAVLTGPLISGKLSAISKPGAHLHDSLLLRVVGTEVILGLLLLGLIRDAHVPICIVMCCFVLLAHFVIQRRVWKQARALYKAGNFLGHGSDHDVWPRLDLGNVETLHALEELSAHSDDPEDG